MPPGGFQYLWRYSSGAEPCQTRPGTRLDATPARNLYLPLFHSQHHLARPTPPFYTRCIPNSRTPPAAADDFSASPRCTESPSPLYFADAAGVNFGTIVCCQRNHHCSPNSREIVHLPAALPIDIYRAERLGAEDARREAAAGVREQKDGVHRRRTARPRESWASSGVCRLRIVHDPAEHRHREEGGERGGQHRAHAPDGSSTAASASATATGFHVHASVTPAAPRAGMPARTTPSDSYHAIAFNAATAARNCIASDTNSSARNGWTCGTSAHFIPPAGPTIRECSSRPTAAIAISDQSLPRTRRNAGERDAQRRRRSAATRATGHSRDEDVRRRACAGAAPARRSGVRRIRASRPGRAPITSTTAAATPSGSERAPLPAQREHDPERDRRRRVIEERDGGGDRRRHVAAAARPVPSRSTIERDGEGARRRLVLHREHRRTRQ